MLNFDSTHKSVDGNVNKIDGKKLFKRIVAIGLIIANLTTFCACAKTVPCDIEEDHAHFYVTQEDVGRYIMSEKEYVKGLERPDNYIEVNEEDIDLLEYMNKHDLFKIEDNRDTIEDIEKQDEDYTEYRYKYIYMQPIPVVHSTGKSSFVTYYYVPMPRYSWTTDTSRNLTGETRTCHHMYYGYKVTQDANGKYHMEKSELVDDLMELPSEYEYVGKNFTTIINLENKEALDYEDGKEDDIGDKEVEQMMQEVDVREAEEDYSKTN